MSKANLHKDDQNAVDDVRRIREKFHRQSGGDIQRHIEQTDRVFAEIQKKLKLKFAPFPPSPAGKKKSRTAG
jgi:hypothetical protein